MANANYLRNKKPKRTARTPKSGSGIGIGESKSKQLAYNAEISRLVSQLLTDGQVTVSFQQGRRVYSIVNDLTEHIAKPTLPNELKYKYAKKYIRGRSAERNLHYKLIPFAKRHTGDELLASQANSSNGLTIYLKTDSTIGNRNHKKYVLTPIGRAQNIRKSTSGINVYRVSREEYELRSARKLYTRSHRTLAKISAPITPSQLDTLGDALGINVRYSTDPEVRTIGLGSVGTNPDKPILLRIVKSGEGDDLLVMLSWVGKRTPKGILSVVQNNVRSALDKVY